MKNEKIKREIIFVCDNCDKKTKPIKDKMGVNPFPYSSGWVYIFKLSFKAFGERIEIKDKHFCCIRCLEEYIQERIKQIKAGKKK